MCTGCLYYTSFLPLKELPGRCQHLKTRIKGWLANFNFSSPIFNSKPSQKTLMYQLCQHFVGFVQKCRLQYLTSWLSPPRPLPPARNLQISSFQEHNFSLGSWLQHLNVLVSFFVFRLRLFEAACSSILWFKGLGVSISYYQKVVSDHGHFSLTK